MGGAGERMCVFEFGVGDERAKEVCLDLGKGFISVQYLLDNDTRK